MAGRTVWPRFGAGCVALSASCMQIAGVDDRPCEPACVDDTTRLACESDGPRAEPCPASENECATPVCRDRACTFEPALGASCGPNGEATCNDAFVCLGPDLRLSALRGATCAAVDDGRVFCWGESDDGQLGDGTKVDRGSPVAVRGLPEAARDISVGYAHACAVLRSGDVYCWGSNSDGQIGTGSPGEAVLEPRLVEVPDVRFVAVTAGRAHTCGLTEQQTVYCWGDTSLGQCGVDPVSLESKVVGPVSVPALSGIQTIETVKDHTCAIRSAAPMLLCWGSNSYVEENMLRVDKLGPGAAGLTYSATPVVLDSPPNISDVGMSNESTWIVTSDDHLYGWGFNRWQQLGVGLDADVVTALTVVKEAPYGRHLNGMRRVLRTDGFDQCVELWSPQNGTRHLCWGRNDHGELAFGSEPTGDREPIGLATPTILPSDAGQLVRGEDHGCVVVLSDAGSEIRCFGMGRRVGNVAELDPEETLADQLEPKPILWLPQNTLSLAPSE